MVLYQLRSQDQYLRNIWLISSLMTIQQMEETPTSTSLMVFTRLEGKHLSTYWCLIIPIKHITFNKGEYIGHLEPGITEHTTIDQPETHSAHSVILHKMMAEQVQPDIFDPPHHKLKPGI